MAFAEDLIKNRKLHGFTQESLAEKCNVSRQAVAKWEANQSKPTQKHLDKLAKLYGCSSEDIMGRED